MVIEPIKGNFVLLRCADVGDVDFTLAIREDKEKTRYLTKFHNTKDEQIEWIERQRQAEDSCFLVYENLSGQLIGTLSFYNIDFENNLCECGRSISWGSPIENVEAGMLLLDYFFNVIKFAKIIITIYPGNKQVISLNKRLGYEYVKDVVINNGDTLSLFEITPEKYYAKRSKIIALLESAKQKGL